MNPTQLKHGKDLSDHLENVKNEEEAKKRTEDCQKELLLEVRRGGLLVVIADLSALNNLCFSPPLGHYFLFVFVLFADHRT